ncbi:NfeD family protein [Hyphomicrobium sulfonivorans]|uniref:NfeD family protein n=1 Tax=Hyphomicrobium sulfonivorans TaxID=121290 RepID=UPI001570C9DA|nr:NfeD family protein [Hyphomicrobium sulfonivorans]MBI1649548.1 NfeD family protein [Hyphomicrobium sulfonivorans]
MRSIKRDARQPGMFVWLLALVSLVLPVVGVGLALYGLYLVLANGAQGWLWALSGVGLLIVDTIIDRKWAFWNRREPALNRRTDLLIGQVVTVTQAIPADGRGQVEAGDGEWTAEGTEAEVGERLRVSQAKNSVLTVERL